MTALYGEFALMLMQGNLQIQTDVQIYSVDQSLGFYGGYSGILWMLLAYVLASYQDYKFNDTIARDLFWERRDLNADEGENDSDPKTKLTKTLNNQIKFHRSNCEELRDRFMSTWCCFCKSTQWYQRVMRKKIANDKIEDRLSEQLDIIQMVKWARLYKFSSALNLRKDQARLI